MLIDIFTKKKKVLVVRRQMIFRLRNIGTIATNIEHKGEMLNKINHLRKIQAKKC